MERGKDGWLLMSESTRCHQFSLGGPVIFAGLSNPETERRKKCWAFWENSSLRGKTQSNYKSTVFDSDMKIRRSRLETRLDYVEYVGRTSALIPPTGS